MGAIIGGIMGYLVLICALGGTVLWFGYWVIKKAVRNGILEAVRKLEEDKNK